MTMTTNNIKGINLILERQFRKLSNTPEGLAERNMDSLIFKFHSNFTEGQHLGGQGARMKAVCFMSRGPTSVSQRGPRQAKGPTSEGHGSPHQVKRAQIRSWGPTSGGQGARIQRSRGPTSSQGAHIQRPWESASVQGAHIRRSMGAHIR